jgi:hypothetical protein
MPEPDVIAQARLVYEQLQDRALSATPLAEMPQWIASGAPPRAPLLRSQGFTFEGGPDAAELRLARKAFTRRWGFSIPCAEAVERLADLGPLVEVGAGTGYWTAMLLGAGLDAVATDPAPDTNPYGFRTGARANVIRIDALTAVQTYPERSVLCSWPTEGSDWLTQALAATAKGAKLAMVGCGRGGSTGNDSLYDLLDAEFELLETVTIPQFPGVSDNLTVYERA